MMDRASFPDLRFAGTLRPSQADALAAARRALAAGERRLHIVAPPGSGKTVLGLYLWAEVVRTRTLALSPNTAIQSQWRDRVALFAGNAGSGSLVADRPGQGAWLTTLTYQSVTLPAAGNADLDTRARDAWLESLVAEGDARDPQEAEIWLRDLAAHNPDYYAQRLAAYRKQVRDAAAMQGDALAVLHASAQQTLAALQRDGIGLIILDECHHLLGHWGRVLDAARTLLGNPVVVGLTATPPDEDGHDPEDCARYREFFGPVLYEVPVPAVVRDGFLAPYQDLAYFVRPAADELAFIAQSTQALTELTAALVPESAPGSMPVPGVEGWVTAALAERSTHHAARADDWDAFVRRDPDFALAGRCYLRRHNLPLPAGVPEPPTAEAARLTRLAATVTVLDRYVRHGLRHHPSPVAHARAEQVARRLRVLGYQITERRLQACASPVSRVLAYSRAKTAALIPILVAEQAALGVRLRAVIIADFEKSAALADGTQGLLDAEAGGAVAAFRLLLTDPRTDALDPLLVTGSSVLVDDDLAPRLEQEVRAYLARCSARADFTFVAAAGFHLMQGSGPDWSPRLYVGMLTDLFQRGVTRCLVGTRGLLGEGWDATRVNVLIDLTTATTAVTVNQVRGRSLRLDPDDPRKLADNWDIVCVAPEFDRGLDDYARFEERHAHLFGITDDGAIEKGVGHVHAACTETEPEGIAGLMGALNSEMLARAAQRDAVRGRWRLGEPYRAVPVHAVERRGGGGGGFPPFAGRETEWNDASLTAAVARALADALADAGLMGRGPAAQVAERHGGYLRAFLAGATEEESALFAGALAEIFGPLDRPRYVMPRYTDRYSSTLLSRLLPEVIGRYFRRRDRTLAMLHAVPAALARNKESVAHFVRHWNLRVSPGEAVYALHGQGETLVAQAQAAGQVPGGLLREKVVFT